MGHYELKDKDKQRLLEKLIPDFDRTLCWAYSEGLTREMGGVDDLVTIRISFRLGDVEYIEGDKKNDPL